MIGHAGVLGELLEEWVAGVDGAKQTWRKQELKLEGLHQGEYHRSL